MIATWTDKTTNLLMESWSTGMSCSQVAIVLNTHILETTGEAGKLTRSAVIGKIHRLKLPKRTTINKKAYTPRKPKVQQDGMGWGNTLGRPQRMKRQREVEYIPPPPPQTRAEYLGISFDELEWQNGAPANCRFARESEPPFTYCGQPVHNDSSYCADCYRIVYHTPLAATPAQIAQAAKMRAARYRAHSTTLVSHT